MEDFDLRGERRMETLSEESIEVIAERAAEKAVQKITSRFYQEVGKSVLQKLAWITGVVAVGLYMWIQGRGN